MIIAKIEYIQDGAQTPEIVYCIGLSNNQCYSISREMIAQLKLNQFYTFVTEEQRIIGVLSIPQDNEISKTILELE